MGGKSSSSATTNQTAHTDPYAPAKPILDSLIGQIGTINPGLTGTESSALDSLRNNARAGNPFAGQIGDVARSLLGGGPDRTGTVNDAYNSYASAMTPFARGDYVDPSKNPGLQSYLSTLGNDAMNRVSAMFAGAGRDLSGTGSAAMQIGKGVSEATAPILYDAYNKARGDQLNAIQGLFGAGGQTAGLLSGLDQSKLQNQQAGIGAASSAQAAADAPLTRLLQLESQARGIPMNAISGLLGAIAPIAQGFGTNTMHGTSNATQQKSLVDTVGGWAQAWQRLFSPPQPGGQPFQY